MSWYFYGYLNHQTFSKDPYNTENGTLVAESIHLNQTLMV